MGLLLNLLYAIVLLIASPWLVYRGYKTGRYREGWKSKLWGMVDVPPRKAETRRIWLHAVSVGEVQLIRSFVEAIPEEIENVELIVSTTTSTGMELARRIFPNQHVIYMPLDFTWAVNRTLRTIDPQLLVLGELEVWPNLINATKKQGCKIAIVNGRLSEKSFQGYQRIAKWIRPIFRKLDWVGVQDATYQSRFVELGTDPVNTVVTGTVKFDGAESNRNHAEIVSRKTELLLRQDNLVWVVGSTQDPEEQYAIEAMKGLMKDFPQLKLIVVPRHQERFEEVADLIVQSQIPFVRRTLIKGAGSPIDPHWRIMLGDTIGELRWWWGMADIALVGGSFGSRGGQNMIEPAAFGVSTAFGPNTKNFPDVVRMLLNHQAATQLTGLSDIENWAREQLGNPAVRIGIGQRAIEVVESNRGAINRTIKALGQLLSV